jgi:hypothetical protein
MIDTHISSVSSHKSQVDAGTPTGLVYLSNP